jgi:hypothetical protein
MLTVLRHLLLLLPNKLLLTLLWETAPLLPLLGLLLLLGALWLRLLSALWLRLLSALRLLLLSALWLLFLSALRLRLLGALWLRLLSALWLRLLSALRLRLLLFLLFLVSLRLLLRGGRYAHSHQRHRADYSSYRYPLQDINFHGTPP